MPNNIFQKVKWWWQGTRNHWSIEVASPTGDDLSVILNGSRVLTFDNSGNTSITGDLTVLGSTTTADTGTFSEEITFEDGIVVENGATIDQLEVTGDATVGGNLNVGGLMAFSNWELNGDTVNASAATLNIIEVAASQIAFTVGAESGGDVIKVTVEFDDANGDPVAQPSNALCWLSDTAGAGLTGTAADALAIAASGVLLPITTGKMFHLICDGTTGIADVNITKSGSKTYYLNVTAPLTGVVWTSTAITFAA